LQIVLQNKTNKGNVVTYTKGNSQSMKQIFIQKDLKIKRSNYIKNIRNKININDENINVDFKEK